MLFDILFIGEFDVMTKEIPWDRYPTTQHSPTASAWLSIQVSLGLAINTLDAYVRALEDYFVFCSAHTVQPDTATKHHVIAYVRDLFDRPRSDRSTQPSLEPQAGLANATIQQRLTVIRLYYSYLQEEGVRIDNPVGRGRYTPGRVFGSKSERGLVPRTHTLSWIPNEDQWQAILEATKQEPLRNRFMFALAYDAALRREELCTFISL